jgi:hypothetical protein
VRRSRAHASYLSWSSSSGCSVTSPAWHGRSKGATHGLPSSLGRQLLLRSLNPVGEGAASVAWGRWWAAPHPRAGAGVELAGRDQSGQGDLLGGGKRLPGKRLAAKQPPPALPEVEPAGPLGMKACWMRGWSASQVRVLQLLWLERLSVITTMVPVGLACSTARGAAGSRRCCGRVRSSLPRGVNDQGIHQGVDHRIRHPGR